MAARAEKHSHLVRHWTGSLRRACRTRKLPNSPGEMPGCPTVPKMPVPRCAPSLQVPPTCVTTVYLTRSGTQLVLLKNRPALTSAKPSVAKCSSVDKKLPARYHPGEQARSHHFRGVLQPLGRNFLLRNDNRALYRARIRDRFNCPCPAEMAVLVEIPGAAAAFYDLHPPVVAVRRDRD